MSRSAYSKGRLMRTNALVILALAAGVLAAGCSLGIWNGGDTSSLKISFALPSYRSHVNPANRIADDSAGSRIIDPATQSIEVLVTAEDLADPVRQTFNVTRTVDDSSHEITFSDSAWGYWESDNGDGYMNLTVDGIPHGMKRTITVSLYDGPDGTGTMLTTGSVTKNIDLNEVRADVTLVPVESVPLPVGTPVEGTVEPGAMTYFTLELPPSETAEYIVSLHSEIQDVNLYVYEMYGWQAWHSWFQDAPPVDEAVIVSPSYYSSSSYFVAVYGASTEPAAFTLRADKIESNDFSDMSKLSLDPAAEPYDSIAGDPSAEELWSYGTPGDDPQFQEIDLGFTFYYNGTPYTKVYVSPNGYVSFWKHRLTYHWWYYWTWDTGTYGPWWNTAWSTYSQSEWYYMTRWEGTYLWGWSWFFSAYGRQLPNELVALYMTPLYKILDPDASIESKILMRHDTTGIDGEDRQRLTIEYKDMYHYYDPLDSAANRYISGQIELVEGDTAAVDPAVRSGLIRLRYDRANSEMSSFEYDDNYRFIGLEDASGEHQFTPMMANGKYDEYQEDWDYSETSGIPDSDYEFAFGVGNVTVGGW